MKNNVLFTVTNPNLIEELKGLGINKFVYPLSFFCVEYQDVLILNK